MMFKNRKDAGQKLAHLLTLYREASDTLIVALPRGGVIVGFEVARELRLPLDIVCPRKIGAPFNPEFAIGAVSETGDYILSEDVISRLGISQDDLFALIEKEKKEAANRLELFRKDWPPRNFSEKNVILVDDGLATGSTMRAAIQTVRSLKAKKIILAIPVSPPDTLHRLSVLVDDTICLHTPYEFYAVGQFYEYFDQVSNQDVIDCLQQTLEPGRR